jgi:6,7-dimethyl-8-ribityllumazine synthase
MKIAIVSAKFAEKAGCALAELRKSCLEKLRELKIEFAEFRVPGTFEIPTLTAKILSSKKFDGVIALGIVVRGETAHFDFVAGNCSRKLSDLGVEFKKPVIFGVLTTNTIKQAEVRAKRGAEFAEAAVEFSKIMNNKL